jgi:transglutaminase-like putative cysteine protease
MSCSPLPVARALVAASVLCGLLAVTASAAEPAKADKPRSRTFEFTYAATVTGLPAGKVARIWIPVPPTTTEQEVTVVAKSIPAKGKVSRDPTYDNIILYFEAKANKEGKIPFQLTYKVTRREVKTNGKKGLPKEMAADLIKRFLEPDSKVPVKGKPLELIKDKDVPEDPAKAARLFYEVVNKHMKYDKTGTGWGQGDAVWACESGKGNCSDFHSLFISLARSRKIPAKFEMGFPLSDKNADTIGGYHCWAWFMPRGKGWIPVDISEANKHPELAEYYFGNLTADRVAFTTGRDVSLRPKQAGPALNFFIYPYVEVDDKPYSQTRIVRKFSFKDVAPNKNSE